jgi:hypothetical protein
MLKLNLTGLTVSMAILAVPNAAIADSWICEHATLVREITVKHDTESPAPCSVVYDKSAEGAGSQVLWSASFDGEYCDAKANGLAEKLTGLGWSCTQF